MLNFQNMSDDVVRVWYGDEQTYVDLHFDADGDIVSTSVASPGLVNLTLIRTSAA